MEALSGLRFVKSSVGGGKEIDCHSIINCGMHKIGHIWTSIKITRRNQFKPHLLGWVAKKGNVITADQEMQLTATS